MSRIAQVSRGELIRRFRKLGFEGPYSGGRHQFMLRGTQRVILPNPHRRDISASLLVRILRQMDVTREAWDEAGR